MTYKLDMPAFAGYPPIESVPLTLATGALPPLTPGFFVTAEDKVWGPGEFVYARAGGSIRQYGLCVLTPVWDGTGLTFTQNMTEAPNTANLGRAVYVAMATGAMTSGQYGWFMQAGLTPINGTASVTADVALGIVAAGQVGAIANGKQIVNGRCMRSAAGTVVKTGCTGLSGDTKINMPNTDGLFVGGVLTGTNVGASAVISSIDPMGRFVIASVANSAALAATVTQTANDSTIFYNVVALNRAFAQGQVT